MTPAELDAEVARVEGWRFIESPSGRFFQWTHPSGAPSFDDEAPPFATDGALIVGLIVKHGLTVHPYYDGWKCHTGKAWKAVEAGSLGVAVCKAVLAAQGGGDA